ncbi:hypothetical protein ACFC18_46695 [Streptomyces sp. NPDC056121]|uniref:hypothetical protein n=1 Tax=unclassified Streptomyces TaxID=2593676 RepID=UPI0035DBECF6
MASGEDLQPAAVHDLVDHMLARMVDSLGAHAGALILCEPGGDILAVTRVWAYPRSSWALYGACG